MNTYISASRVLTRSELEMAVSTAFQGVELHWVAQYENGVYSTELSIGNDRIMLYLSEYGSRFHTNDDPTRFLEFFAEAFGIVFIDSEHPAYTALANRTADRWRTVSVCIPVKLGDEYEEKRIDAEALIEHLRELVESFSVHNAWIERH